MVGYEPCQKHVRTFSPSMTPKLERLSLTETAHNYRLGERLRLRLMVALLTLVGKCSGGRAKPARFGCHLPVDAQQPVVARNLAGLFCVVLAITSPIEITLLQSGIESNVGNIIISPLLTHKTASTLSLNG